VFPTNSCLSTPIQEVPIVGTITKRKVKESSQHC
jgi:hypothetical protein